MKNPATKNATNCYFANFWLHNKPPIRCDPIPNLPKPSRHPKLSPATLALLSAVIPLWSSQENQQLHRRSERSLLGHSDHELRPVGQRSQFQLFATSDCEVMRHPETSQQTKRVETWPPFFPKRQQKDQTKKWFSHRFWCSELVFYKLSICQTNWNFRILEFSWTKRNNPRSLEGEVTTMRQPLCKRTAAAIPREADLPRPRRPKIKRGRDDLIFRTFCIKAFCSAFGVKTFGWSWFEFRESIESILSCTWEHPSSSLQTVMNSPIFGSLQRLVRSLHHLAPNLSWFHTSQGGVWKNNTPPAFKVPATAPKVSKNPLRCAVKTTRSNSCPIHALAGGSLRSVRRTRSFFPDVGSLTKVAFVTRSAQARSPISNTKRRWNMMIWWDATLETALMPKLGLEQNHCSCTFIGLLWHRMERYGKVVFLGESRFNREHSSWPLAVMTFLSLSPTHHLPQWDCLKRQVSAALVDCLWKGYVCNIIPFSEFMRNTNSRLGSIIRA